MKFFRDILSDKEINTGRQVELDIAKALIILCMPIVHCLIECTDEEQLLHGLPYFFDMIVGGTMGAPMFMFCMGVTFHFSKDRSAAYIAKRGLFLLVLGFALNICRYLIPFVIGHAITGDKEQFLKPIPYLLFGNDIFQFAGISMFLIALMLKLKLSKPAMFGVALAMSVVGSFIREIDLENDILNVALGWFVGTENETGIEFSCFPLINWFIVPVSGYLFGSILMRIKDKKRFYLSFAPLLLVITVAYMIIGDHLGIGMFAEGEMVFYHLFTYDAIICIAFTIGLMGFYCALNRILPDVLRRFFTYTSRNITEFYCFHAVYVCVVVNVALYVINGTKELALPYVLLISLAIIVATFASILLYRKIQRAIANKERRTT